jgi:hypothetical protein
MTNDQYVDISNKLAKLIRLTAISIIGDKALQEQYNILSMAGFQPKEIASICGSTPNSVRVALFKMRKSNKGR